MRTTERPSGRRDEPLGGAVSELVIAEGVELELRPAGIGSRFLALLLDLLAQIGLLFAGLTVVGMLIPTMDPYATNALVIVVIVLVCLGYPIVFETMSSGRSLGKMAAGLRVVRTDGGPVRFRHAAARSLTALFADLNLPLLGSVVVGAESPLLLFLVGTPGALAAAASARSQRIGDLLAGTMVVRERDASRLGALPVLPSPQLLAWAGTATVGQVPAGLIVAARQLVSRVFELDRPAAAQLATELAGQVSAYVRPAPPPGTPAYLYLVAVTGERYRRETGGPLVGVTPYSSTPVVYTGPRY